MLDIKNEQKYYKNHLHDRTVQIIDYQIQATFAIAEQQERTANALERIADAMEKKVDSDVITLTNNSDPICFTGGE